MKKRRLIALLLCFCMTTGTFTPVLAANEEETVSEEEATYNISYKSTNSTRRSSVTSCSGFCPGTAEIYAIVSGNIVTEIVSGAFSECQWNAVYIPASITTIADDAFDEDSEIIIKCSQYSAAYQYAIENNMAYELTASEADSTVYMSDVSAIDNDRYTGNQGDSYIAPYNKDTTVTGISSTNYTDGLGAWIARWNFTDEKSWVWNEYNIDSDFETLTGYIDVRVTTYNSTSYDTTIQFIGDDVILAEYSLNPDTQYPVNIDTDVSGVDVLKINVFDNTETSGGTEFILGDIALHKNMESDIPTKTEIPEDAVYFKGSYYKVFKIDSGNSGINAWNEAKTFCEGLGGHLAIISSQDENDFLYSYTSSLNCYDVFFGYSDYEEEGTWEWVDGVERAYTNWHNDEPNSKSDTEDFAMFFSEFADATWNDGTFDPKTYNICYYLCEWEAADIPHVISTTFDTNEITLAEGATFNFEGLVSTTAETGLNDLQINIANAETGVGIKYHREDDIGTSEFDLSAVPPFVTGTTLTGEDQQGYKHTLELTAGTSWYVHLFATDNDGNSIGEDVVKKITITENPGEFLIGNKYIQTSFFGKDTFPGNEGENTPYILFTDNNKGEFYVMTYEPDFCGSYYFTYTVEGNKVTLLSDDEYGFNGSANKITLEIIDNTTLKIVSFEPETIDGLSYCVGWSAIGDTFETEITQVKPTVAGLRDNYTVTQGEDLLLEFSVTAGDDGMLNRVSILHNEVGTSFAPITYELNYSVNTFSADGLELSGDNYPLNTVGTHEFVVYASADNYTVTDNSVAVFTVTVVEEEEKCEHDTIKHNYNLEHNGKFLLCEKCGYQYVEIGDYNNGTPKKAYWNSLADRIYVANDPLTDVERYNYISQNQYINKDDIDDIYIYGELWGHYLIKYPIDSSSTYKYRFVLIGEISDIEETGTMVLPENAYNFYNYYKNNYGIMSRDMSLINYDNYVFENYMNVWEDDGWRKVIAELQQYLLTLDVEKIVAQFGGESGKSKRLIKNQIKSTLIKNINTNIFEDIVDGIDDVVSTVKPIEKVLENAGILNYLVKISPKIETSGLSEDEYILVIDGLIYQINDFRKFSKKSDREIYEILRDVSYEYDGISYKLEDFFNLNTETAGTIKSSLKSIKDVKELDEKSQIFKKINSMVEIDVRKDLPSEVTDSVKKVWGNVKKIVTGVDYLIAFSDAINEAQKVSVALDLYKEEIKQMFSVSSSESLFEECIEEIFSEIENTLLNKLLYASEKIIMKVENAVLDKGIEKLVTSFSSKLSIVLLVNEVLTFIYGTNIQSAKTLTFPHIIDEINITRELFLNNFNNFLQTANMDYFNNMSSALKRYSWVVGMGIDLFEEIRRAEFKNNTISFNYLGSLAISPVVMILSWNSQKKYINNCINDLENDIMEDYKRLYDIVDVFTRNGLEW